MFSLSSAEMGLTLSAIVAVLRYFPPFELRLRFDEFLRLRFTLLVNGNELAVISIPPLPRENPPLAPVQ